MDQSLQTILYPNECAEIHDVSDCTLHDLPDPIPFIHGSPRIGPQSLDTEPYPFSLGFYIQDVHVDQLSWFEHITRVSYPPPGEL